MEMDAPRWSQKVRLHLLWYWPLEPRKKIKRFLKFGDDFLEQGRPNLAQYSYHFSKRLAQRAGTVHLLKKIEKRLHKPW